MMTPENFNNAYLRRLSLWRGYHINENEDFDMICECQVDFIEILLIGEQEFSINLLENTRTKDDFITVKDFLKWALTNYDHKTDIRYEFTSLNPSSSFSKYYHSTSWEMVA